MRHDKSHLFSLAAFLCVLVLASCSGLGNLVSGLGDATLSALSVSAGTLSPSFDPQKISYTVTVPNSETSLVISATPTKSKAMVVGTGTKSLNVGSNTFDVKVTSEDGLATKTYTVTATRESLVSDDARLASLSISPYSLSPAFDALTTSYGANVANSVTSVTVTATSSAAGALVEVSGGSSLSEGINTVTVKVTALDAVTTKTYTISVTKAGASASSDATLSSMSLSAGSLSPAFSASTFAYTANVSNATNVLTVTATPTDSGAVAADGSYALAVGPNTIEVLVTAADGTTTQPYTITVTRAASSDANLKSLSLSTGTLSPAFSVLTTSYSATVANGVSSITVTGTAKDAGASVAGNGSYSLAVGSNTIELTVTAADGITSNIYTVDVTRAVALASTDSSLSNLSATDGSTPYLSGFAPATLSYDITVPNFLICIDFLALPTNSGANVLYPPTQAPLSPGQGHLDVGPNTFEIKVTAEDGISTTTYTIKVTRAGPATTLALASPAAGSTVSAGIVNLSGSWTGVNPASIRVLIRGIEATATLNLGAKTWQASIDASGLPNSSSVSIVVIASDSSSNMIAGLTSSVSLAGGTAPGFAVHGTVGFIGPAPATGTLWAFLTNGPTMFFVEIPLPTADYSYSLDGVEAGTWTLAAIYSTEEGLDFLSAYEAVMTGGNARYGLVSDLVVNADTTAPVVTINLN